MWFIFFACSDKSASEAETTVDSAAECTPAIPSPAHFGLDGQGISDSERETAEAIGAHLLSDPAVAFVYWRNDDQASYTVHFPESSALLDWDGRQFHWSPLPPINTDSLAYPDLQAELDAGSNPNAASIAGYEIDDSRLSFIPLEQAVWPNLEARIAQIFDHPNSPDMAYALAPYARGGVGSHGGLSLAQSRAPLLMRGPGLKAGSYSTSARHIDIAPTIAHLLGVDAIDQQQLIGQDGSVLNEVLQDCAFGQADYAVLLILDGLSHTELREALDQSHLPQLSRIDGDGVWLTGGSIVGWPSFSFPGHVSIHMGAYQGHHGILSNSFWNRDSWSSAPSYSLSTLLADGQAAQETQAQYLSPHHESLFEAIGRQYPDAQTASINELTFRGATYSRLAENLPQNPSIPPPDTLEYELADASAILQFQNMVDAIDHPKFLSLSLYLTDAVGQYDGPHGDDMRSALITTDAQLKAIFDSYEAAGIWDQTLFVVTADHGMELQDPTRTASQTNLSVLNLPITQVGQMIYFNP